jgi:glycosyltransferase involved in cell wall biosynthesis
MTNQSCSLLLPLYNGAKFINRSLPSILDSMRPIDELVIVNDGSTDISLSELKILELSDSRIKVINKEHSGIVETLNKGLQHCENEFIARVDIDDIYNPKRISTQVAFMGANPNCAAVFSDYQILSRNCRDLGTIPTAISPSLTRFSLINPQRTPHSSVMFRKTALYEVGSYKHEDFPVEDLALWINLSESFEIATIPETLLYYTLHSNNITKTNNSLMRIKTEYLISKFARTISVEEILDHVDKGFQIYDSNTYVIERKILFFRDLAKYYGQNQQNRLIQISKQISLLTQVLRPSLIPNLIQLQKMQRRRRLI